ncbi:MAG: hypothetical protein TREMPRED_001836 [Tremellales sp. Tagirdzhanova-0007]|nr:MAG: hypothetical protein TREMPRED_001836 [Tremellales sp. Tagirdzhanova-0007]
MELGAPIGANASPVKHYQFTASDVSSTATKSASFNTGQTAVNGHSDPMRGQHYTAPGPPVVQPAETDSEPVSQIETASSDVVERIAPEPTANHSSDVNSQPATATIDPNVPSSGSKPTALPTDPSTHPEEMRQGIEEEHPAVVSREFEKTRAEERELKGERPEGTVVAGLEDDRLYAMLRRFDTQIAHVLHPATKLPPAEPDLRPSTLPNLPSHSETLKANLERSFAAIGPSSIRGMRETQRLMSWSPEERRRTGAFCAAYFTCWIFGYAVAGVFSFFVAVVCFPDCRRYFFPPIPPPPFTPPSATDPTNQKGDESLLGNTSSKVTHRSKAEQAEEQAFEATSILQAYTTRLIFDGRKKGKEAGNSTVGEKQAGSSSDEDEAEKAKQTTPGEQGLESADVVIGGKQITPNKPLDEKAKNKLAQREAKRKRDEMVSKMTKATEDTLGALADLIERMNNALSPPVPYPDRYARFKIAGAFLIPPMFLFTFVPPWVFARSATFFFGVGMWAQPVLIRGMKEFQKRFPNWEELLDMRNSILSGVPTDQQLTLHLLRVAEALNSPLPRPPPPPLKGTPKEAIKDTTPASISAEDDAELVEAQEEGGITQAAATAKHKTKSHFLGVFQKAGKKMAGFHGDVAVDGAKKQFGTKIDKLFYQGRTKDDGSPESYPAKLDGTTGHIILESRNEILDQPQVTFVPLSGKRETFVFAIDDIVELKKAQVSLSRLALGWASGAEVEGLGLTIRFKTVEQQHAGEREEGTTMHFTQVGRREQLFVRLVSMGRQRWEVL